MAIEQTSGSHDRQSCAGCHLDLSLPTPQPGRLPASSNIVRLYKDILQSREARTLFRQLGKAAVK
jgi:hypothetical protein